jgi:ribosome modulation factor
MSTDNHPYVQGIAAKASGQSFGANPYNPESETVAHEQWLDGWADEQDEQASFEALF